MQWTTTQDDLRLRAVGGVQRAVGRVTLALRLGAGTTIVHEDRVRNLGTRAGLMGSDLETTAVDALPAADLEAVVLMHVFGPWSMVVNGGPSIDVLDGGSHVGWTAELGVAWQP